MSRFTEIPELDNDTSSIVKDKPMTCPICDAA